MADTLQISELEDFDPHAEEHYPPKGTEEACLAIVIDRDTFRVLGHTGRYMHAQINLCGFGSEELALGDVPDEPGFWVMERGRVWEHRDWETGIVDDCGCDGEWRPAALADFDRFEVPLPACLRDSVTPTWQGGDTGNTVAPFMGGTGAAQQQSPLPHPNDLSSINGIEGKL